MDRSVAIDKPGLENSPEKSPIITAHSAVDIVGKQTVHGMPAHPRH